MVVVHTGARVVRAAARLLVVVSLVMAAACASTGTRVPDGTLEPDKFLFERGSEALNRKRWLTSREFFRTLMDGYPQSPHRADAKLGIGDSFLGERTAEAYVLAINEYREFLAYYPTHDRAHYAQFQLAMAYFNQMRGPERDQTDTKSAIQEFTVYIQRYKGRPLFAEAQQKLREARDRLSLSEYRVGYFYYRTQRWYPGAIDRFVAILRDDPEFTHRDDVYFYLAQSYLKIERPAEALPYLDRLLKEFEQSAHLEVAKKQVEEIRAQLAKKTGSQSFSGAPSPALART
jgi:outer membrane protein assembly factor BamD